MPASKGHVYAYTRAALAKILLQGVVYQVVAAIGGLARIQAVVQSSSFIDRQLLKDDGI
jgi:hypothetical protein